MGFIPHGMRFIPHGIEFIPHGIEFIPHGIGFIPHGMHIIYFTLRYFIWTGWNPPGMGYRFHGQSISSSSSKFIAS